MSRANFGFIRITIDLTRNCHISQLYNVHTLTCQIIMQQILLFFEKKNTYTTLLGPTRSLISEKSATYTIKWSYTIIWQVRVVTWGVKNKSCPNELK